MSPAALDQAAQRAAFAAEECEGKDKMVGASSWSKPEGFVVPLVTLRLGKP